MQLGRGDRALDPDLFFGDRLIQCLPLTIELRYEEQRRYTDGYNDSGLAANMKHHFCKLVGCRPR